MISGVSSFTLVALPLFVLAGTIMNAGGISGRLFDFARALVGWMRGGLAHVDVLTSIFFGGMIGSSTADLAGTGSITIPAMKRHGYPPEIAAAVSASSSGIGPLIPPSSPMILYSAITGVSLGSLFLAGLIPGILLGLVMMGVVAVLAHRRGWPRHGHFSLREIWKTGVHSALLASACRRSSSAGSCSACSRRPKAPRSASSTPSSCPASSIARCGPPTCCGCSATLVQLTGELLVIVSLSFALGAGLTAAHAPQALAEILDRDRRREQPVPAALGAHGPRHHRRHVPRPAHPGPGPGDPAAADRSTTSTSSISAR